MGSTFHFDEEQFNRLFPFFILVDRNLNLLAFGRTLGKLYALANGQSFDIHFKVKQPEMAMSAFDDLLSLQNQLIVLEDKTEHKNLFRGQIEYIKQQDAALFVGSPWFNSMDALRARGLTLHDFAYHDPLLDLLYILKTQDLVNEDIKKLLATVSNQQNELKYQSLFLEQTTNAVIITNNRGQIEWVNNAFNNITGYTLAEAKGKRPSSFLEGEGTNKDTTRYLRGQTDLGEPFQAETLNYTKQGKPYWAKINGQPIKDKTGKTVQFLVLHEDITFQKTADLEMDKQREFYENMINLLPANIAVFSPDGRFLFLNPASIRDPALRQWMVGKHEEDYANYRGISNKIALARRAKFEETVRTKQLKTWEEALEKPGEPTIYFLRNLYPVVDEDGIIKVVIGYGINITELKNIQHELELAKQKTEDMAEARQKFLATMSHEIRTPMNGILGISGLFEKTILDPQQKQMLGIIQESAKNLLAIANDVLDLEKIVAGKIELETIPFGLLEKIHLATESFKFKAREKHIKLLYEGDMPANLVVQGDPFRLSQVLTNLIENALKFTEKGSITVSATLHQMETTTALVSIKVRDTGIGISADRIAEIFEPYVQANASISRKYGGTGLGLSICRELVNRMGGKLTVDSIEGHGSCFELLVPFELGSFVPNPSVKLDLDLKLVHDLRILVAEDLEINQFLVKHILQSWNCQFTIVDDGYKAIAALEAADFDLILMDIQMPEMDGIEACKAIRALNIPHKAATPVVALTAYALRGDHIAYLEAGMNDYLSKPFTEADLYEVALRMANLKPVAQFDGNPLSPYLPPLYNLSQLIALSKSDPNFVCQMVQLFLQQMPILRQQLREAAAQKNWTLVATTAHKMKPTLDYMGIQSLKQVIRAVEICTTGAIDKDQLLNQVNLIDTTLKECMEQLQNNPICN